MIKQNFKEVFSDKSIQIYENTNDLGRAFFVYDYIVAPDDKSAINTLLAKDFDYKKQVVLEEKPYLIPENIYTPNPQNKLVFEDYKPQYTSLSVSTQNPAILFSSDTYYPGRKPKYIELIIILEQF
jgi:hypothetical protein